MGSKRKKVASVLAVPVVAKVVQRLAGKVRRKPKTRWESLVERANKTLQRRR